MPPLSDSSCQDPVSYTPGRSVVVCVCVCVCRSATVRPARHNHAAPPQEASVPAADGAGHAAWRTPSLGRWPRASRGPRARSDGGHGVRSGRPRATAGTCGSWARRACSRPTAAAPAPSRPGSGRYRPGSARRRWRQGPRTVPLYVKPGIGASLAVVAARVGYGSRGGARCRRRELAVRLWRVAPRGHVGGSSGDWNVPCVR
jgi:hypothetical protein